LYSFAGTNDGATPNGLVQGSDGYFYGTTAYDYWINGYWAGCGTVFKISPSGVLTTLHLFNGTDGANSSAALVQGSDGNLYGTTYGGGTNGWGTVFKISPSGALTTLYSFGTIQDLYNFNLPLDGGTPNAALVQGSDGNFYGTTSSGGTNDQVELGYGTVFKISPNGVLTTLYCFGSLQDTNGVPLDGAFPNGLVQGNDGNFYGTTQRGGPYTNYEAFGTVFKITTNGALTLLYSFAGGNGCQPNGLTQGSDGYFYVTTPFTRIVHTGLAGWGPGGDGIVCQIRTNGAFTALYGFGSTTNASGVALDGSQPSAALVQGSDGNFYGTTGGGGTYGNGTVFRLTIVPDPQLTIIPSGPYVILTWPTDHNEFSYAGFTLQSTTNLGSSAVWTTNSSPPVVIGGENVVINTMSGRQQFYRLSQ
jgi:uncharacterized repeat protein (TIGR03803 family)